MTSHPDSEGSKTMSELYEAMDALRLSSSAAQVLSNDYILRNIFNTHSYLYNDYGRLQNDDLARCARVCQAFSEPALRVLWRELASVLPIWHLLSPPDLPYPRKREQMEGYCAAVLDAETYRDAVRRERFRSYTSYVYGLSQSGPVGRDIPLLFSVLRREFHEDTLFPFLRQLRWTPLDGDGSQFAVLFSPNLATVELDFSWFSEEADHGGAELEALRSAAAQSPGLKTLTIRGAAWWTPGAMTVLSSFRCLRKVELFCDVEPSVLPQLVQITTLRSVSLRVGSPSVSTSQLPGPYDAPHLEELVLIGTPPDLLQLLLPMRAAALGWLDITLTGYQEHEDIDHIACVKAAANAVSPGSLRSIVLNFKHYFAWRPRDLMSVLRPLLLQLPGVTLFRLNMPDNVDTPLTEDDLARFAGAWGDLEAFALAGMWDAATPAPSANVLHHFWKSCPRLRHLSLPYLELDADIAPHEDPPSSEPSSHGLRSLIIDLSLQPPVPLSSDRTRAWALYLLRLFPHLESPSELHTALNPTWRAVFQEMCSLSAHDGCGNP
ncbi:hypothetical protein OH76DRAFT_1408559 [Lentinus brumalis]|uniref:F-box domain-containing protein n=1 Tax=Lentinus brumalis TaxID=2498619 RepID=A0A371CXE4_9APHY|nr:hypothetical protein OH76DRAFT_1408559 [Polyporus brumalis]